jgi:hypothetical protein
LPTLADQQPPPEYHKGGHLRKPGAPSACAGFLRYLALLERAAISAFIHGENIHPMATPKVPDLIQAYCRT